MIEASFACATRLFGLAFKPLDVALYHPDCRAWEVTRGGEHVAVFIGDYFARGSKRSGAWCSAMRGQAKTPKVQGPVVIDVCNFAKGDPALLSYDDARTLFHEFGHALIDVLGLPIFGQEEDAADVLSALMIGELEVEKCCGGRRIQPVQGVEQSHRLVHPTFQNSRNRIEQCRRIRNAHNAGEHCAQGKHDPLDQSNSVRGSMPKAPGG